MYDGQHEAVRPEVLLSDQDLALEVLRMTDHLTDELVATALSTAQRAYYGFCDRLRIDCLYRSGKLRGGALIHAVDEGLLRHIPQAKLDYDIGRWSTLEV